MRRCCARSPSPTAASSPAPGKPGSSSSSSPSTWSSGGSAPPMKPERTARSLTSAACLSTSCSSRARVPSTSTAAASRPAAAGSPTARPPASTSTACSTRATASASRRSPACPSCCSRRTSCSAPPTRAGSLSPLTEAPSTSSSCWSRGAANTCTRCARPQVGSGHRGPLGCSPLPTLGFVGPCPALPLRQPRGALIGRGGRRSGTPRGEARWLLVPSAPTGAGARRSPRHGRGRLPAGIERRWELAGGGQRGLGNPRVQPETLQGRRRRRGAERSASGCCEHGLCAEALLRPWSREGEVPRGIREGLRGRDCPCVLPALSPPLPAPLHGAHVRLCGVSPRHPPGHQQPRHRLRGPAGRSCPCRCPRQDPVPTQRSQSGWGCCVLAQGCDAGWSRGRPRPLSCPAALRVQHPREAVHGLEPHGAERRAAQGLAGEGYAHHPHRLQPPEPRAHPAARRLHVLRPRQVPGERGWGLPARARGGMLMPVEQGKGTGGYWGRPGDTECLRDRGARICTRGPSQPAGVRAADEAVPPQPLPDASTPLFNQSALKQLPEPARQRQLHAFKICKKFQPLLFAELLEENRLVLVERPLADIRAQLPPPVQQQPFGT
uniref:Uncharacterized protein n=1 Tax=Anser cygnoides TaxID=8845 RepID=A0A8B9EK49_ANSCY